MSKPRYETVKITAEALQEVILATIPKEEHHDLYTLEEMSDEDRAQVEMAATLLTERFVTPLVELIMDYQRYLHARPHIPTQGWSNERAFMSWVQQGIKLDARANETLGKEVKE